MPTFVDSKISVGFRKHFRKLWHRALKSINLCRKYEKFLYFKKMCETSKNEKFKACIFQGVRNKTGNVFKSVSLKARLLAFLPPSTFKRLKIMINLTRIPIGFHFWLHFMPGSTFHYDLLSSLLRWTFDKHNFSLWCSYLRNIQNHKHLTFSFDLIRFLLCKTAIV